MLSEVYQHRILGSLLSIIDNRFFILSLYKYQMCLLASTSFIEQMQIEYLMQLGFTEKEASVYLMLLRMGPLPASSIAKRLSIKRVTAYSVLNSLCERGVVSFEEMKQGRRFIPHDPEAILYNLEKQESEIRFRMQVAKTCVQKLQTVSLPNGLAKQKVLYHKGQTAIVNFLKEKFYGASPLHVLFLDYGTESESSKLLHSYLQKIVRKYPDLISLCVPAHKYKSARQSYDCLKIFKAGDENIFTEGELLIYENTIIYIFSNQHEVELMCLEDPFYTVFVKRVFFDKYFV